MNRTQCGEVACGAPQIGPGHPRKGWIRVTFSQVDRAALWFCSERCVGVAFTEPLPIGERLSELNRLAGTRLCTADVTPAEIGAALRRVFAATIVEVCREPEGADCG